MIHSRWSRALIVVPLAFGDGCAAEPPPQPKVAAAPVPPADADGDGVPDDGTDRCLDEKEDGLPPRPKDGCKSSDADGDGVPDDGTDHCLGEKEDGLLPDPQDGCKSTDPDNDGIKGDLDKCPEQPETRNGFDDEDGCPDTAPRVQVTRSEVRITEKIMFAFGKATIEKESDGLLDEIATVVDKNPQIEFIEVAGHADKIGDDASNVLLTRQRAQAVVEALAKRGIDRKRMRAQGYGRYCQLDLTDSDAAREKNRRVEFKILRIDSVETGVAVGCEEAVMKGVRPSPIPKTAPTRAEIESAREKRGPLTLVAANPPPTAPAAAPQPPPRAATGHHPPPIKHPAKKPSSTTGKQPAAKTPKAKPKSGARHD